MGRDKKISQAVDFQTQFLYRRIIYLLQFSCAPWHIFNYGN